MQQFEKESDEPPMLVPGRTQQSQIDPFQPQPADAPGASIVINTEDASKGQELPYKARSFSTKRKVLIGSFVCLLLLIVIIVSLPGVGVRDPFRQPLQATFVNSKGVKTYGVIPIRITPWGKQGSDQDLWIFTQWELDVFMMVAVNQKGEFVEARSVRTNAKEFVPALFKADTKSAQLYSRATKLSGRAYNVVDVQVYFYRQWIHQPRQVGDPKSATFVDYKGNEFPNVQAFRSKQGNGTPVWVFQVRQSDYLRMVAIDKNGKFIQSRYAFTYTNFSQYTWMSSRVFTGYIPSGNAWGPSTSSKSHTFSVKNVVYMTADDFKSSAPLSGDLKSAGPKDLPS